MDLTFKKLEISTSNPCTNPKYDELSTLEKSLTTKDDLIIP